MTTTLVQISDLHFGALNGATLAPLQKRISDLQPDLLVVSGDLTQRARPHQFDEAATFIASLHDCPRLIVPGNHDVPLWNLWRRFIDPHRHFNRHFGSDHFSRFTSDSLAILGIDTTRSFTIRNGRINKQQLTEIADFFAPHHNKWKIVVAHHPFVLPEDVEGESVVGRANTALASFLEEKIDLLLTGHRHVSWNNMLESTTLTVHAGTATSSRTRSECNAFNELRFDEDSVTIRTYHWQENDLEFQLSNESSWQRHQLG